MRCRKYLGRDYDRPDGFQNVWCQEDATNADRENPYCAEHLPAKDDQRRRERNFSRRARYAAYRSAGMVRTPYGWE